MIESVKTLSTPLSRLTLLDALRGFSLLGVILMHMLQQFSIQTPPDARIPLFPEFEDTMQWIGRNVIMGRFINIFAFLFGLSFFIQMDRAAKKGVDFRRKFIWRMIVMLVIGLIGNCFYRGEIISLYAIFGIILALLYRLNSGVLICLAFVLLLGTPRIIQVTHTTFYKTEQSESPQQAAAQSKISNPPTVTKPSFVNSVKYNFTEGLTGKLNYQFGFFGRGYITFALFILGLVIGRTRFFEHQQSNKVLAMYFISFSVFAILIISIISILPVLNFRKLIASDPENIWSGLTVMTLNDLKIVIISGAITTGFALLYQNRLFTKYLDVFSSYGRMGLTNYQMQGLIGCLLFSAWAFGPTFQTLGLTELFLLGIVIYILQLIFSNFWLKKYLYGPLEWVLRSATYLKSQPFRKK